ncbi:putative inactive purple acid phosphatase 1-like protein, partial [Trifolium pratense]
MRALLCSEIPSIDDWIRAFSPANFSGNHECDWPGSGSFYGNMDSVGECGVLAETMFYVPASNRAKFWYSIDYGMFRFCVADTEHDWREGTEQYKFIEHCLVSVDRQ